jgi:putative serine protease PepD
MITNPKAASTVRLITAGALIAMAAYWAGSRWGEHEIQRVENVFAQGGNTRPVSRPANLTEDEALTVKIYSQASPAVANINTQAVEYDFFRNPVPVQGAGSGFVIDPRGYVVTNYHVVQGAQNIEVILGDRVHYPAKFVGADEQNDVALVKIDPKGKALVALPLGDSANLLVGQKVLAIGNPFGFSSTLTTGVVSAIGRTIKTGETTIIDEAIQTDAAINQGNSGGPLLNTHGEVIGINSAIYTPSGTTAGIGFAIPINTAKNIAQDLIAEGRVHRASLGIPMVLELWPDLAEALSFSASQQGLLIERITANGPAARGGLKAGDQIRSLGFQRLIIGGDLIVAIDGKDIARELDLDVILNHKKPGDAVRVTVFRGGKKMDLNVTLGEAAQSVDR